MPHLHAPAQGELDVDPAAPKTPREAVWNTRPAPKSGVEKVLSSPTFWNQVIRVGGQVARTFWGTARR